LCRSTFSAISDVEIEDRVALWASFAWSTQRTVTVMLMRLKVGTYTTSGSESFPEGERRKATVQLPERTLSMKNTLKYSLVAAVLLLSSGAFAHAGFDPFRPHPPTPVTAPEVDPGMAMSGLTLLAGTLTILRAKRSK
jgi:hypothetical protein